MDISIKVFMVHFYNVLFNYKLDEHFAVLYGTVLTLSNETLQFFTSSNNPVGCPWWDDSYIYWHVMMINPDVSLFVLSYNLHHSPHHCRVDCEMSFVQTAYKIEMPAFEKFIRRQINRKYLISVIEQDHGLNEMLKAW